jgi:DNA-binding CsgD family transcriptional regulator/5-methylcytosine-specific restriction endonuclease McrA
VPDRRRKHDWAAIREFYDADHSAGECQERFGVSRGAWHRAVARGDIVQRERSSRPERGVTRKRVKALVDEGLSQAEIAAALGVSRPTVCFHMRKLGVRAQPDFARRYHWPEIAAFYAAGHSFTECRVRFGFNRNAWADAIRRGVINPRPRAEPIELILAEGRRRNRTHVKARLLMADLKGAGCEECGLTEWRSSPISLELHHVNGQGEDNRLENLRLLCPNCHSQTDTWGGRNKGRTQQGAANRSRYPGYGSTNSAGSFVNPAETAASWLGEPIRPS